ncbi:MULTISPECIES: glycoside hydrolase family 65 protein [Ramlibacter]|uniref:Glycoside hydrolase family 65 protein n=1 Tax=Ramlibacter pinisoli TaxID=2682844 RepID=A0A6N8IWC4_9BURK|nr:MULTISPECIES: glycosyl hydrolase family 65 protein [Ramlibacter]MBA2961027.1 glycoside hydrolase family 65 protein [Ramlibacter sp. CGMCC 1.13660]MVQ30972.1 glycoside hydrolase family 65 protein [Ramlibacter pinisoli]
MLKHEPVLPPEIIYPIEEWRWVEKSFAPGFLPQAETVFTVSNGYLGIRGAFEEGGPAFRHGTFVNGFHETWPIPYGEWAFGFATTGQTIANLPDAKIIRLYVDDEPFDLANARLLSFERALDMRAGTLERRVLWETPAGRQVLVESQRLVSFQEKHVAAISYRVTVLNAKAALVLSSEVVEHLPTGQDVKDDPRLAHATMDRVLSLQAAEGKDRRVILGYRTTRSGMTMACGIDHVLETDCTWTMKADWGGHGARLVFSVDAEPGKPIALTKYITHHTSRDDKTAELCLRAGRTLDRVVAEGFGRLLDDQRAYLDDFWHRSDIQISSRHPRMQQCLRWNLFQLIQACGRADRAGIAAKGLTSQTYDGHYFWDMEIYVLPFLIYTSPSLARNVLRFRYSILDKARERARAVGQKGALFPWRTISGDEASAYYAAGTAQYHINAAVAHGIVKYVDVTGDRNFLLECGAEMLVETARLWFDLGFFSPRRDGRFCIHRVTGPDEYTTVVNNNTYTNLMARDNLRFAADAVDDMRQHSPDHYRALVLRTGLDPAEADDWRRAAERMYVPFDERSQIHPQDDDFLDLKKWDFEGTPRDQYPLLLHFHPLVIYRHQVIKQADVVLAMFLLGNEFTLEQKRRNFDYYDELTTGDSSLSACIQSILAFEVGHDEHAISYLISALLMDLADVGARDGCHIASMGGTWMGVVYGVAGLRDNGGRLTFQPHRQVQALRFRLSVRGQQLAVEMESGSVTYRLEQGDGLTIWHRDERLELQPGRPVQRS